MAKTYSGTFRVPGGFEVQNPTPPDDRFVVDLDSDLLDINQLDNIYEGISVYSKESKNIYVWNGQDRANSSNWIVQGTSSTPTFQDIIDAQSFGAAQFPSGVEWEDDGDELLFKKNNSRFSISGTKIGLTSDALQIQNSQPSDVGKILKVNSQGYFDLDVLAAGYTSTDFDNDLATKTTNDLAEGSVNFYATGDEFQLSTDTLDDVLEGATNKHFTQTEKTKLSNQSGTNTGDENTASIQSKRPLKTVEGQSLEGVGNIDLDKTDVGLGNVDNTSDFSKPISTATQNALNDKQDKLTNVTPAIVANSYTLQASDFDKILAIQAPCTVVVPNGLAANLQFQGKQLGGNDVDVVEFVAESGGTLNVTPAFQNKTDNINAYWAINTLGSDVADLFGTLKLAE